MIFLIRILDEIIQATKSAKASPVQKPASTILYLKASKQPIGMPIIRYAIAIVIIMGFVSLRPFSEPTQAH